MIERRVKRWTIDGEEATGLDLIKRAEGLGWNPGYDFRITHEAVEFLQSHGHRVEKLWEDWDDDDWYTPVIP